jgi:hypothetical protein
MAGKGESKLVTPEEHEQKRKEARDRKQAQAHARSAHKKEEKPSDEFDWHFSGSYTEDTWLQLEEILTRNKHNFVNTFHLRRLVGDNRLKVVIDEDEPIIGGSVLLVTFGGFKLLNGEPLPCRVYRVIVDIDRMFSHTYTYCRDKYSQRMAMMVH